MKANCVLPAKRLLRASGDMWSTIGDFLPESLSRQILGALGAADESILRTAWCAVKCCSRVNAVLAGETYYRHALGQSIMRNQPMMPEFPSVMHGLMRSVEAFLRNSSASPPCRLPFA